MVGRLRGRFPEPDACRPVTRGAPARRATTGPPGTAGRPPIYRGRMRFGVLGPLDVRTADGRPVQVPERRSGRCSPSCWRTRAAPSPRTGSSTTCGATRPPGQPRRASRPRCPSCAARWRRGAGGRNADGDPARLPAGRRRRRAGRRAGSRHCRPGPDRRRARQRAALLGEALAAVARPGVRRLRRRGCSPGGRAPGGAAPDRVEERAEARLELGEHAALGRRAGRAGGPAPAARTAARPAAAALYRAGRQGEALAGYDRSATGWPRSSASTPAPSWPRCTGRSCAQDPA